jgi:hypothetical protein
MVAQLRIFWCKAPTKIGIKVNMPRGTWRFQSGDQFGEMVRFVRCGLSAAVPITNTGRLPRHRSRTFHAGRMPRASRVLHGDRADEFLLFDAFLIVLLLSRRSADVCAQFHLAHRRQVG